MNTTYLLPEKTKMTLEQIVKKYQCLAPEYSAEAPGSKVMEKCYLHVSSGHPVGLCNTRLFRVTRAWKN